jgi:two-component system phosphate regulon sensor histidine kinase PhoR
MLITLAAHNDFFNVIKNEVKMEAEYIRAGYELSGASYLESLDDQSGHRLTLILPDGSVSYDSRGNAAGMDNHLNRPEVKEAFDCGSGESRRVSDTFSEETYYYAVLLDEGSVLRISSTTASIFTSFGRLVWIAVLIAVSVFAVSSFIASRLTRRIVKPINALDLEYPENNAVYEELVPLVKRIREQRSLIDAQILEHDRGRREFEAITENMSEGFLVLDISGKALSYNKSAARLLTASSDNVSGMNILELNRGELFREFIETALKGFAQENVLELHGRQCQLFANPVKENGTLQGLILLMMDVTEKQEREKLRREFTANVSHELKTPLTAISGYAEIISNGIAKTADVPGFAGSIYRETQRMINLVNDLMFLSGLEENTKPVKGKVNLLVLSEEISRRLAIKASEHNVDITVSGDNVEIEGIPSVLEEVIYNLIDNAIKYNKNGGNVIVSISAGKDAAVLTVKDTGIGIPKAEYERIFERFYRVDKSHNSTVPGTGLGLSIVKHGMALHRAKVEVYSTDCGSCFTVVFPIKV